MGDLAWLAPVQHKDTSRSKSRLQFDESLLIGSRPGSATSIHSTNGGGNHLPYKNSNSSMQSVDTKWKPHKLPMSAVKGAWQYNRSVSPFNKNHDVSRAASPNAEGEMVLSIFNLATNHKGHLDDDLLFGRKPKRPLSSRSRHGRQIHVDDANSVNKNLEGDIEHLQGALLGEKCSNNRMEEDCAHAEFLPFAQAKSIYGKDHSPAEKRHGKEGLPSASHREDVYVEDDPNGAFGVSFQGGASKMPHLSKSGNTRRNSEQEYVIEDLERESSSDSQTNNMQEIAKTRDVSDGKGVSNRDFSGDSKGNLVQFIERSQCPSSENGTELPSIVVNDIESSQSGAASFKKAEDVVEARKRKLKMKMRHANLFKHLFDEVHAESMKATLDLGNCYNTEDLKVAKAEEKRDFEREKTIEALKPQLPQGLPVKGLKDLKTSKSKTPSYSSIADAGQLVLSPESIKVMRETLEEKRQQLFGDQPWLLGRLALSKDTCRFELPMDLLLLRRMTPLDYVTRYTVINRRRKSLYKSCFLKTDKDRDGWISYKDLIKALKDIHVNYIDENEIDELIKILNLDVSADAKFNLAMFTGIVAFSERLVLHMRKQFRSKGPFGKERLEDADFDNLKWKLKGVDVNPAVMRVLNVL